MKLLLSNDSTLKPGQPDTPVIFDVSEATEREKEMMRIGKAIGMLGK